MRPRADPAELHPNPGADGESDTLTEPEPYAQSHAYSKPDSVTDAQPNTYAESYSKPYSDPKPNGRAAAELHAPAEPLWLA